MFVQQHQVPQFTDLLDFNMLEHWPRAQPDVVADQYTVRPPVLTMGNFSHVGKLILVVFQWPSHMSRTF